MTLKQLGGWILVLGAIAAAGLYARHRWSVVPQQKANDLVQAVRAGDANRAAALLDEGADVNRADANGHYALYVAFQNQDNEMIQMLLRAGADPATCSSPESDRPRSGST